MNEGPDTVGGSEGKGLDAGKIESRARQEAYFQQGLKDGLEAAGLKGLGKGGRIF